MKKSKRNKKVHVVLEASTSEHMCHLPNKMHLQACIEGARVQRNRKKYTRKGKDRFDARKFEYWFGLFCVFFSLLHIPGLLLQNVHCLLQISWIKCSRDEKLAHFATYFASIATFFPFDGAITVKEHVVKEYILLQITVLDA